MCAEPSGSTSMGDNEYSGPCSCLLNCVRAWREREELRRHTEFLRKGESSSAPSLPKVQQYSSSSSCELRQQKQQVNRSVLCSVMVPSLSPGHEWFDYRLEGRGISIVAKTSRSVLVRSTPAHACVPRYDGPFVHQTSAESLVIWVKPA